MFLCIRPSVSKLKNHIVFFIQKKQYFSMHFCFNNQFIKVKRTLTKISKTNKNFILLSFSIWGTTFHVIRILDIKFFFSDTGTVRFYPIKIRTSLQRSTFLKAQIDKASIFNFCQESISLIQALSIMINVSSYLLDIGPNNSGIPRNFIHLLQHFGHLLYKQHVASIQGIVVGLDLVLMVL